MKKKLLVGGAVLLAVSLTIGILIGGKTTKSTSMMFIENWDMPPAYNGNPYLPGGAGAVKNYIYGKLAIYRTLDNTYKNYLAESFKVEENQLTVTLKDGIKWDDGVPFTSQDVKTHFIIKSGWEGMPQVWDYLDSIETPDDLTIIFNLKEKHSDLTITYILDQTIETPHHIFKDMLEPADELIEMRLAGRDKNRDDKEFTEKYMAYRDLMFEYKPELPLGYGPYTVKKVTSSDIVLDKVENYPGNENNTVEKLYLTKGEANELRWTFIKADRADMKEVATPLDVVESILGSNDKLKHITVPYFTNIGLYMNIEREPFNDLRFRKALAYIIDRDKAKELAIYYGTTIDKISGVLPSVKDKWIDDSSFESYNLDHVKAEDLLKEIGMTKNSSGLWCDKNGKELSFQIIGKGGRSDFNLLCEEIARQLTLFGINTGMTIMESSIYDPKVKQRDYDMTIEFTFNSSKHPFEGYKRLYMDNQWGNDASGFDSNIIGPDGEQIDLGELTKQISETSDFKQQKELIEVLAWATNTYLPVIDILEKNSQCFVNFGGRVEGWPQGEELDVGLASSREMHSMLWLMEGQLKSV